MKYKWKNQQAEVKAKTRRRSAWLSYFIWRTITKTIWKHFFLEKQQTMKVACQFNRNWELFLGVGTQASNSHSFPASAI